MRGSSTVNVKLNIRITCNVLAAINQLNLGSPKLEYAIAYMGTRIALVMEVSNGNC